jgi:hypothetical protein
MDTVPTVWYKVATDERANLMNIRVLIPSSGDYSLSVFKLVSDCNTLEPVSLWINSFCRNSFGQRIEVEGISVDSLSTYMIAVTSADQSGNEFTICVSLNEDRIPCLLIGDIVITERSSGQEVEAPYLPGEEVGVCMVVNEFQTGGFNGCQWFQGLIPYFGPAWDPSSFDGNGQPLGATVNNLPIGETSNGLYGPSTWDWFTDIGYHWTNDTLQIGDIDGNGTPDLCNSFHEDCLDFGGVTGGCCPACWEDSGQKLPPGWFAYGINGSCAEPDHPTIDWGDGNSCYGSMGPWYFCFDLTVKSFPACLQNDPETDLIMKYYTKSDGETGAYTGGLSLCVGDKPRIRNLSLSCGTHAGELESVSLPPVCIGDTAVYLLSEPGVIHWYWNVEPVSSDYPVSGNAPNESFLEIPYANSGSSPLEITYFLRGSLDSTGLFVTRTLTVIMHPNDMGLQDVSIQLCEAVNDSATYIVNVDGDPEDYSFYWPATGDTTSSMTVYPPYVDTTFIVLVTDSNGCVEQGNLFVSQDSSCVIFEFDAQYDESNEGLDDADPPMSGGKVSPKPVVPDDPQNEQSGITVYPLPANESVNIHWTFDVQQKTTLNIFNMHGVLIGEYPVLPKDGQLKNLDTSTWLPGMYIIRFGYPHSHQIARMIKY